MTEPTNTEAAPQGNPEEHISFAQTLGFFDATMIGVGAMIGAGIFVLTGIACGEAGPAALIAFVMNGAVTLITAMVYSELASSIPKAGGGYAYVKSAFPDVLGFTAGWWLWFAYTVACALYAAGFGSYFFEFLARYFPATAHLMTSVAGEHAAIVFWIVLSGITFTLLNIKGAAVSGKTENVLVVAKIAVLLVFIMYGIEAIYDDVPAAKAEFEPFMPSGLNGILIAMGLTFIAFEGYDLIATVAEEIKDPGKNIPRATFVSVGIAVFIYICVLIVSLGAVHPEDMKSYEFLGKYQETAIVKASAKMMPGIGVFLIVLGGVLSTISALNATVMASSRVAFSMARDGWLPARLARIHPKSKTPAASILLTGVMLTVIAVALPVNQLGSAASIMFLLVFAMVNLALIALRRKQPNLHRPFRTPLYPVLPIVGFTVNLALALYQMVFDFQPWVLVVAWTVTGLLLYYTIFEKKVRKTAPQTLELQTVPTAQSKDRYRILVPLHNPNNVEQLMELACAMALQKDGEVVAMCVIKVPEQLPINEGLKMVQHYRPILKRAKDVATAHNVPCHEDIRLSHNPHTTIPDAVGSNRADMTIMGWKGWANTRDRIFGQLTDHMIRHCPSDLCLAKLAPGDMGKLLLATSGGPNAQLAATMAKGLGKISGATTDTCVVVPKHADAIEENQALRRIEESIQALNLPKPSETKIIKANSVAAGISKESKNYDLTMMGAAPPKPFKHMLLGDIPEKVAHYSPGSVIVIRKWEGFISGFFRRLFG